MCLNNVRPDCRDLALEQKMRWSLLMDAVLMLEQGKAKSESHSQPDQAVGQADGQAVSLLDRMASQQILNANASLQQDQSFFTLMRDQLGGPNREKTDGQGRKVTINVMQPSTAELPAVPPRNPPHNSLSRTVSDDTSVL